MKKVFLLIYAVLFVLYILLLSNHLLFSDIIGLFLLPLLIIITFVTIPFLISRIYRKSSYKDVFFGALRTALVMQSLLLVLAVWSVYPRYYSREQIIQDINYASGVMEDVHPDLYAMISKVDFIAHTDSVENTLPAKISEAEAYKVLCKVFAPVHDGHTGCRWNNIYTIRGSGLFRKILPLKLKIIGNKIFVAKDYKFKKTIPSGAEILKVNGIPSAQCIQQISHLLSYENSAFRNTSLSDPSIWGLWNDFRDFDLTYRMPDEAKEKTVHTSGGLISRIMYMADHQDMRKNYIYKTIENNIGYIAFNAFYNPGRFRIFLDSTFSYIKDHQIKHLIIDIRNNGGGNSMLGDELMQYISKNEFTMCDSCMVKISSELLKKGILNWVDSSKRIPGTLYNFGNIDRTPLRENPLRFRGDIYLLTSGHTFSSASMFASAFKCFNTGKIIGTETGGLTVSFGDLYMFQLPETKIGMKVSYKKFYNACGLNNRRGVIPDYIIQNSLQNEKKGIDSVLDFTVNLIQKEGTEGEPEYNREI